MDYSNRDTNQESLNKKLDAIVEKQQSLEQKENDKTFVVAILVLIAIAIIGAICYFAVGYFASGLN